MGTDHVMHQIARAALELYALPAACDVTLVNISENVTYRVSVPGGFQYALRIHRRGYHSDAAILSELNWLQALRAADVALTPVPVPGRNGALLQSVDEPAQDMARRVVLFQWENGVEPSAHDLTTFELLGEQAANLHRHVRHWPLPADFTRHEWTFATSLGDRPHWGRWRDGLGMTPELEHLFGRAVDRIERRLSDFGQGPDRFGLVHGDMRLANLLIDGGPQQRILKLIDFDDCGFSWNLYDCATTVSFFEHETQVPDLLAAWVRGYRRSQDLSADMADEIPTFVLLRRLLLIAWLSSRPGIDLALSLGSAYTHRTAPMCQRFLQHFG
jgi:Ser/Thr protein kinase RdoA (MazF antagonist)